MDTKEISPPDELAMSQPHLAPGEVEQVESPNEPPQLAPLWRNRDFMLLWSGQTISTLGTRISGIAFPLLILSLTNSYEAAGIASALFAVPYLLFSLPVGALVDRWDRKLVMILCDTGRALNMASLPLSLPFGGPWLPQLYLVSFIEGTLFVFFNLAEVAALPQVVAKAQLPAATSQNQAAEATASLIGPGVGTFLYGSISRIFPFVFDAVSYALSVVSLLLVKGNFQQARVAKERHLGREIKEGVVWLWHQPVVRFTSLLTGAVNFVFAGSYLIVIARAKELGAQDEVIGVIFSIGAAGAVVGSAIGGRVGKRFPFGPTVISIIWIQLLLLPLYAVAPSILALGLISAISFLTIPIYNVVVLSYRLSIIPDELQGRVNSAARLIAFGFQPFGATLAGFLLEKYSSALAIAVFTIWLLVFSVLATLNSHVRGQGRLGM